MRLLVLGGTAFLSRAVAANAVACGHDVTCAARGHGGAVPAGATLVQLDRAQPDAYESLRQDGWDAVVDVARQPSWVRDAVRELGPRTRHWTFVSTCSVYADPATPGQTAEAPIVEAPPDGADETDRELYGELKVACEEAAADGAGERLLVNRPGLIVGPGDPSGRFAYWPHHVAAADEVAVPGTADDPVQVIDVRDLAAWIVHCAEQGRTGVYDGLAPPTTRAELLEAICAGVDRRPELTWVSQEFLVANGVAPWMGPRSLPLWLPLPEYAGFMARDVAASIAAGLVVRPLEDTARDTHAWLQASPDANVIGLSLDEERELLSRWHQRPVAT